MSTWLHDLARRLENLNVSDLPEPREPVGAKEHVEGEASVGLKQIYMLIRIWGKEGADALVAANYATTPEEEKRFRSKFAALQEKVGVLKQAFWAALKDEFELWEKPGVGIRAGWKVVSFTEAPTPPRSITAVLESLLALSR